MLLFIVLAVLLAVGHEPEPRDDAILVHHVAHARHEQVPLIRNAGEFEKIVRISLIIATISRVAIANPNGR